jgi:hypothetical protein
MLFHCTRFEIGWDEDASGVKVMSEEAEGVTVYSVSGTSAGTDRSDRLGVGESALFFLGNTT